MTKNKTHSQFTYSELSEGYSYMDSELRHLDLKHPIRMILMLAKADFESEKFSYDGATFVKERTNETVFEVAAFIHDWRNSMGYVSYKIDREFIDIMICLNYDWILIFERYLLTRFTFLNIIRHALKGTIKKELPSYLYKEKTIFINPIH